MTVQFSLTESRLSGTRKLEVLRGHDGGSMVSKPGDVSGKPVIVVICDVKLHERCVSHYRYQGL